MFVIIGVLVVIGGVLGGYIMEHGNLSVLYQPAEIVIIFGAAIGSFLIATPLHVIVGLFKRLPSIINGVEPRKDDYLELLVLLYHIFGKMKKEGYLAIESDIEKPSKSGLLRKYMLSTRSPYIMNYICDNLKVIITTDVPVHELDNLMELEIDTTHQGLLTQSDGVSKIADAMPGLGLVAAVLGVVLTMGKIDQPPSVIGHSVAAALLGTFIGILFCYGFLGPLATNLEHKAQEEVVLLQIVRVSLLAFLNGSAPIMAVEFGRRAISGIEKPTFDMLEKALKGKT